MLSKKAYRYQIPLTPEGGNLTPNPLRVKGENTL